MIPIGGGNSQISAASGVLKPSIILFDYMEGTRSVTLDAGRYRIAVVGAGGGGRQQSRDVADSFGGSGGGYAEKELTVTTKTAFTYTVGVGGESGTDLIEPQAGGTTSFGGILSATGGEKSTLLTSGLGGLGIGGDVNTQGGQGGVSGKTTGVGAGGGSAAHRFGNGLKASAHNPNGRYGAGFSTAGGNVKRSTSKIDGWGLGLLPEQERYGCGAASSNVYSYLEAGMGGGGMASDSIGSDGGLGGGSGSLTKSFGGNGLVIVEKLS